MQLNQLLSYTPLSFNLLNIFKQCSSLNNSVAEPEPHLLVGAGARAVTQCGSGSDGSGSDNDIKQG
jgi:hypothetical protein